jgi:hypothetical protein
MKSKILDFSVGILVLFTACFSLLAQPTSPPPPAPAPAPAQDPLIALMNSAPRIRIASNVTATASFDPPTVRPGQLAIYRVAFDALQESIAWPQEVPAPPKLELTPGAHGEVQAVNGAELEPHAGFNYRVRASESGQFTIPAFAVKVYGVPVTVPAATLTVEASPQPPARSASELVLVLPQTNLFVGQTTRVILLFPHAPDNSTLMPVQGPPVFQLTGEGFMLAPNSVRQLIEANPRSINAGSMAGFVYEAILTPITAGRISAFAQAYVGNRPSPYVPITFTAGSVIIMSGPPQYTLLDSQPVELNVKPLPRHGELPGFTGLVGAYKMDPPILTTNSLRVGDALKLTVKAHSDGQLERFVAPPPPQLKDWQIFPLPADSTPAPVLASQGFVTFGYTLIPLTEEVHATPAIPFSCFDPAKGAYVDLTITSVPVQVKPSAAPTDFQSTQQADSTGEKPEKEPTLSDLASTPGMSAGSLIPVQLQAWFPLVQVAPGVFFLGLLGWDRRRRYLEQHPDVVMRRRARRALWRERQALRQAARCGDTHRFASAAVSAMRVACAPHFPAEPRALVCGDVLQVLPESERSGRASAVIKSFFEAADASRFAPTPSDAAKLLALQSEVENLLTKLEEKL